MATEMKYPSTYFGVKSDKSRNFADRINFIKYWVAFIQREDDVKWSKGQADFIDAQFEMARRAHKKLLESEGGKEKFDEIKKLFFKLNRVGN